MCTCACQGQRTALAVIPHQAPFTLYFETLFLMTWAIPDEARLASQRTPGICPSLPPKSWDYRFVSPSLAGPHTPAANTSLIELFHAKRVHFKFVTYVAINI